jgi:hypothetical protein
MLVIERGACGTILWAVDVTGTLKWGKSNQICSAE